MIFVFEKLVILFELLEHFTLSFIHFWEYTSSACALINMLSTFNTVIFEPFHVIMVCFNVCKSSFDCTCLHPAGLNV